MDQFTKNLTKTLLSNGDVKELFRQQLETAINHILQAELTALLGYDPYDRSGFIIYTDRCLLMPFFSDENILYYRILKSKQLLQ